MLARWLLVLLFVISFVSTACVIPPPPLVDDPIVNTPPRLLLENFESPKVGQNNTVSATAGGPPFDRFEIVGRVEERNRQDTLTVRVFVNAEYTELVPIDPPEFTDPGNSAGIRPLLIQISGLCDVVLPTRGFHVLELYITDGSFAGQTGRDVTAGSGRDNVSWRIECTDPLPVSDGGP